MPVARSLDPFAEYLSVRSAPRGQRPPTQPKDEHMNWLYLGIAVVFEVAVGIAAGKARGFTEPKWTAGTLVSGAIATFFLSLALLTFDVGVGYALWTSIAGIGIVVVGALFLDQRLTLRKLVGIVVVVAGVVGLNLAGTS